MYKVYVEDQAYEIEFDSDQIMVNGQSCSWDAHANDGQSFHIISQDKSYRVQVRQQHENGKELTLDINGHELAITVQDRYDLLLEKLGMDMTTVATTNEIHAPMPGLIVELKVQVGDQVETGDPLLVLEAMKMENVLKAPGAGTVQSISVKQGDSVEKNQILVNFE